MTKETPKTQTFYMKREHRENLKEIVEHYKKELDLMKLSQGQTLVFLIKEKLKQIRQ